MSDFGTLKRVILGCVTRMSSSFQTSGQNYVDVAINNAIIYAQRKANFEWCKDTVSVVCSPKGNIMQGVDSSGRTVLLKNIIKCFGDVEPTGHGDLSIPYLSRVSQIGESNAEKQHGVCGRSKAAIHQGQFVYITPQPSSVPYTMWFEAVKWLPRVVVESDTNFLFTYGFDFLMYRSILELNFFIKEDERMNVTSSMLKDSWDSLMTWDASLLSPTETEIDY